MELGTVIAINLKELGTERNLTLGQLSKISGVSKAMLSDIEKGDSNPTINTILQTPRSGILSCSMLSWTLTLSMRPSAIQKRRRSIFT